MRAGEEGAEGGRATRDNDVNYLNAVTGPSVTVGAQRGEAPAGYMCDTCTAWRSPREASNTLALSWSPLWVRQAATHQHVPQRSLPLLLWHFSQGWPW